MGGACRLAAQDSRQEGGGKSERAKEALRMRGPVAVFGFPAVCVLFVAC